VRVSFVNIASGGKIREIPNGEISWKGNEVLLMGRWLVMLFGTEVASKPF
jgi:hypothetical protein